MLHHIIKRRRQGIPVQRKEIYVNITRISFEKNISNLLHSCYKAKSAPFFTEFPALGNEDIAKKKRIYSGETRIYKKNIILLQHIWLAAG